MCEQSGSILSNRENGSFTLTPTHTWVYDHTGSMMRIDQQSAVNDAQFKHTHTDTLTRTLI